MTWLKVAKSKSDLESPAEQWPFSEPPNLGLGVQHFSPKAPIAGSDRRKLEASWTCARGNNKECKPHTQPGAPTHTLNNCSFSPVWNATKSTSSSYCCSSWNHPCCLRNGPALSLGPCASSTLALALSPQGAGFLVGGHNGCETSITLLEKWKGRPGGPVGKCTCI